MSCSYLRRPFTPTSSISTARRASTPGPEPCCSPSSTTLSTRYLRDRSTERLISPAPYVTRLETEGTQATKACRTMTTNLRPAAATLLALGTLGLGALSASAADDEHPFKASFSG